MVGIPKWTEEQILNIFEFYHKGKMEKWQIADIINVRWPRKAATSAGITYVLNTKKKEYAELKRQGATVSFIPVYQPGDPSYRRPVYQSPLTPPVAHAGSPSFDFNNPTHSICALPQLHSIYGTSPPQLQRCPVAPATPLSVARAKDPIVEKGMVPDWFMPLQEHEKYYPSPPTITKPLPEPEIEVIEPSPVSITMPLPEPEIELIEPSPATITMPLPEPEIEIEEPSTVAITMPQPELEIDFSLFDLSNFDFGDFTFDDAAAPPINDQQPDNEEAGFWDFFDFAAASS